MDAIEFESKGRTFSCRAESSPATPGVVWWWIAVSDDANRYAGFRIASEDTAASVKLRVVAYYDEILAIRQRPRITRPHWVRPAPPTTETKS
jgi:hypothetical protein